MLGDLGLATTDDSENFDDVGDITLTFLTIDGNTVTNDELDGEYVLAYAGNVYASGGDASVNSLTIGPVSVSNNSVPDADLVLNYMLAMDYNGNMVYAGVGYTATLGDVSIGTVTIDGNAVGDADSS